MRWTSKHSANGQSERCEPSTAYFQMLSSIHGRVANATYRKFRSVRLLIDEWGMEFEEAARLLDQAGDYLRERGQYAEAEPLLTKALAIREKILGSEHHRCGTKSPQPGSAIS